MQVRANAAALLFRHCRFAFSLPFRLAALGGRWTPKRFATLRAVAWVVFILAAIWSTLRFERASWISSRSFFIDHVNIRTSSPSARKYSSNIPRCQNHQSTEKRRTFSCGSSLSPSARSRPRAEEGRGFLAGFEDRQYVPVGAQDKSSGVTPTVPGSFGTSSTAIGSCWVSK
jgi:hypothetical protein